jgi:hypothetical protein
MQCAFVATRAVVTWCCTWRLRRGASKASPASCLGKGGGGQSPSFPHEEPPSRPHHKPGKGRSIQGRRQARVTARGVRNELKVAVPEQDRTERIESLKALRAVWLHATKIALPASFITTAWSLHPLFVYCSKAIALKIVPLACSARPLGAWLACQGHAQQAVQCAFGPLSGWSSGRRAFKNSVGR